ncbi:MAG: TraM recognition domain-containing protein [Bacteroidales bacterium]|nr:TraM recognition domain-containing protein [Bacteroidales bacterium]
MGTPGSGKSASIIEPYISQTIGKGFSMVCYDYKYPVLSNHVYSEYLKCSEKTHDHYGNMSFMCLSLSDLRSSMRCNPIVPESITDMTDAFEMAEILLKNLCPETIEREDFFSRSAKALVASSIWYLRSYDDGEYCTLPHLVEFMSLDYKTLLGILQKCRDIGPIMTPFVGAMNEKAQNQLQGQLASAQMPLSTLNSKQLYWLLSKDEVSLDVNNPVSPIILCIGSNPARQKTYSAIIALICSRIFKLINVRGKNPSAIVLDEFPTVYLKGIDELIATARSNKVAVLLGAQDKIQIVRDYGVKEADAIVGTVGNIICGQVNGKTADEISRMFGERKVRHQSTTISDSGDSVHDDSRNEKLLPSSEIQTFSQGVFCGRVSDNSDTPIERKLFYGKVDYEKNRVGMGEPKSIPMSESFALAANAFLDDMFMNDCMGQKSLRSIIGEDAMLSLSHCDGEEKLSIILGMPSEIAEKTLAYLESEILEENYCRIKGDVERIVSSASDMQ